MVQCQTDHLLPYKLNLNTILQWEAPSRRFTNNESEPCEVGGSIAFLVILSPQFYARYPFTAGKTEKKRNKDAQVRFRHIKLTTPQKLRCILNFNLSGNQRQGSFLQGSGFYELVSRYLPHQWRFFKVTHGGIKLTTPVL